jgi:O-antigen ligase
VIWRTTLHITKRITYTSVLAILLLLPILFNPYSESVFESTKIDFFRCVVGIMVVAFAARTWLQRSNRPNPVPASRKSVWQVTAQRILRVAVLLYGAVHVLASLYSADPKVSIWGYEDKHGTVTTLALLVFFCIVSNTQLTRNETIRTVAALLIGTVPVSLYGISQAFGMDLLGWDTNSFSPTLSTIGRSNFVGAYLSMVIPFTWFYFSCHTCPLRTTSLTRSCNERTATSRRRTWRWRLIVLALIQMTCLLLTEARAALLASMAGSLTYIGLLAYRKRWRGYLILMLAILVIASGALLLVSTFSLSPERSDAEYKPNFPTFLELRRATFLSRLTIWRGTLELYSDRWLLGYGPERFAAVFNSRFPPDETWGDPHIWISDPHNVVLDHLISTGAIGLLTFAIVVGAFFSVVLGNLRLSKDRFEQRLTAAITGAATAYLVQAQANPDVILTQVLFWWTLALGVATARKR